MGLEDENERTNVVISKEEITPSTFVPKNLYPRLITRKSRPSAILLV